MEYRYVRKTIGPDTAWLRTPDDGNEGEPIFDKDITKRTSYIAFIAEWWASTLGGVTEPVEPAASAE